MRSYITLATIRAEREADQASTMQGQEPLWTRRYRQFVQAVREQQIQQRQGQITQVDVKPWEHEG